MSITRVNNSLKFEFHNSNFEHSPISKSQAVFDKAMKGLPEEQRHLLFIDRVHWKTIEPVPEANPYEFDKNEFGYHDAMMRGFEHLRNTIGERMDADKLCQLHDICVDGVFHKQGSKLKPFRKGYAPGFSYGLDWERVSEEAKKELESKKLLLRLNSPTVESDYYNFAYLSTCMPTGGCGLGICSRFEKGDELPIVHQKIDALFDEYYAAIESAYSEDDRLAAIVNLCRALQIFHVFPDGNGRTILAALLSKLLIENGFSLCILTDFAHFGTGYNSTDEMVNLLKEGMDNYRRVAEQLRG
jgi:hypothetical protein